jgi:hypothetical protein
VLHKPKRVASEHAGRFRCLLQLSVGHLEQRGQIIVTLRLEVFSVLLEPHRREGLTDRVHGSSSRSQAPRQGSAAERDEDRATLCLEKFTRKGNADTVRNAGLGPWARRTESRAGNNLV